MEYSHSFHYLEAEKGPMSFTFGHSWDQVAPPPLGVGGWVAVWSITEQCTLGLSPCDSHSALPLVQGYQKPRLTATNSNQRKAYLYTNGNFRSDNLFDFRTDNLSTFFDQIYWFCICKCLIFHRDTYIIITIDNSFLIFENFIFYGHVICTIQGFHFKIMGNTHYKYIMTNRSKTLKH